MSYEVTNTQLAWLAGIIDGEGCITAGIYPTKVSRADGSQGYKLSYFVSVTNTNDDIILAVNELFAALTTVKPVFHIHDSTARKKNPLTQKTCYRVHVAGGKQVSRVLTAVLPYLVGKRKQAEVLLAVISHRERICAKAGHRGAGTKVEEDLWLRSQMAQMREFNHRGPVRDWKSLT